MYDLGVPRKHILASAATGPESVSQLLEPAISGITAVVSADSAVRNAAVSLPAAKTYLAARLTRRCTTPTCTMSLGTSRNCGVTPHRFTANILSLGKDRKKVSAVVICRVQYCDVTTLCSA